METRTGKRKPELGTETEAEYGSSQLPLKARRSKKLSLPRQNHYEGMMLYQVSLSAHLVAGACSTRPSFCKVCVCVVGRHQTVGCASRRPPSSTYSAERAYRGLYERILRIRLHTSRRKLLLNCQMSTVVGTPTAPTSEPRELYPKALTIWCLKAHPQEPCRTWCR